MAFEQETEVEAERPTSRVHDVHVERFAEARHYARAVTCQRPVMPAGTRKRSK